MVPRPALAPRHRLIADPRRLGVAALHSASVRAAWASGLRVSSRAGVDRERGAAAVRPARAERRRPCFLLAPNGAAAVRLSRIPGSVVAVRLPSLTAFQRLGSSGHGRILGIVPLRLSAGRTAWLKAIALARRSAKLDLAVAPVAGAKGAKGLATFEQLLNVKTVAGVGPPDAPGYRPRLRRRLRPRGSAGGGTASGGGTAGGTPADTLAPTTPLGLTKASWTTTSITISWSPRPTTSR